MTQTHVKYGSLTGLAMVIMGLIVYVTGLSFTSGGPWINYIPFIIGLILNANAYSKANNANVTFGNVFGSCFKATAIIAVIVTVWTIVFVMIFPEFKDKMIEMQTAKFEAQGMSEEQMQTAMSWTQKFMTTPMMAVFGFLGSLVMGTIFSLIAAAIAKKNPQPQQIQP